MLPNLIVIGAGKCGTSSLYYYLGLHPEITMSREKELRFFSMDVRWRRGVAWYEDQFDQASTPVVGEASPQYAAFPMNPDVPERMRSVLPDARLIYLVRDPIERMLSSYLDAYSAGREDRSFAEAVRANPRYLSDSLYHVQLERYLPHYPLERILVLSQEVLLRERRAALRRVFEFLGVDPSFDTPRFDELRNAGDRKRRGRGPDWLRRRIRPKPSGRIPWAVRARIKGAVFRPVSSRVERPAIEPELRAWLQERVGPDAEALRSLTGEAFEDWSV